MILNCEYNKIDRVCTLKFWILNWTEFEFIIIKLRNEYMNVNIWIELNLYIWIYESMDYW